MVVAVIVALGGCATTAPEDIAIPAPAARAAPTPPPPPPAALVREVMALGDGEIVITLTPAGLDRARGRDGAREVARRVARHHAPLREWAVPHLSGELRAHALAHASRIGGEVRRRANPVNVELGDYREGVGDGRWRALG